jgi:hypothetical protein
VEPILLDLLREAAAPFLSAGPRPAPAARHDHPIAGLGRAFLVGTAPFTADLPAVRVLAVDAPAGVFWVWDGTDAGPWDARAAALGVHLPTAEQKAAQAAERAGRADAAAPPSPPRPARAAGTGVFAPRLEPCALLEGDDLPADLYARFADRPLPPPGTAGGEAPSGSGRGRSAAGAGAAAAAAPPPPAAALPSYPPLGSALPVALLLGDGAPRPPLPSPGAWVRLDKLAGCVVGGQLQAVFMESSHWSRAPPPAADAASEAAASRAAQGHLSAWAPADPAALVASPAPGGPAAGAPRVTLRQASGSAPPFVVAAARGSGGGGGGGGGGGKKGGGAATKQTTAGDASPPIMRSLVRITSTDPAPAHAAAACVRGAGGLWEFRVALALEDGTGRATALAGGPDGGGLFAGIEPRDLGSAPSAAAAVGRRLAALVGGGEGGGAWAEVGLARGDNARKRRAPGAGRGGGGGGLSVVGTQAALPRRAGR